MNRIKIMMLSMLAAAVVFSSCTKDDEDDPIITPSGPILTLSPESVTGWVGDNVSIEYTISTASSNEIVALDITTNETQITPQSFGVELDDNFVNDSLVFTMPSGPAGAVWEDGDFFEVTFIATHEVDGIQYTTTKSVTVTYDITVNTTPLVDEQTGVLNHILDNDTFGAFDLVNNVTVAQGGNEADKDMVHVTDGLSDTFNPVWTVGTTNMTTYVAAPGIDYDNVTLEDALAAYGDGSSAISTVTFAEGEIYVARLRDGANGYAVIRIDAITMSAGNNDDTMTFSYKR